MKQKIAVPANENWINTKWRPVMGWTYIIICLFDFIIGPMITFYFFGKIGGEYIQWKPLTLVESGLFHISMGAILGVVAYTRGQEKINRYSYRDYGPTYEPETDRADYRDRLGSTHTNRED